MKYYAVIDTNVIVSAIINPNSVPGKILKFVSVGMIVPFIDDEILNEYISVISRKEFKFKKEDIDYVQQLFGEKALKVDRTTTEEQFVDKKDIVFYEITLTGRQNTDAFLVTGNLKHFPKKPFVVSPREMLTIIEEGDDLWNDAIAEDDRIDIEKLKAIIAFTGSKSITNKKNKKIALLFARGDIDYETAVFAINRNNKNL